MLPNINGVNTTSETMPSYTYNLNLTTKRIIGNIDNIEAVRQSVLLILMIERYGCPIYNWAYGVELESLIGQERDFIVSETRRRITEALVEDDRILGIDEFNIEFDKDSAIVTFIVLSTVGFLDFSLEVNI